MTSYDAVAAVLGHKILSFLVSLLYKIKQKVCQAYYRIRIALYINNINYISGINSFLNPIKMIMMFLKMRNASNTIIENEMIFILLNKNASRNHIGLR